MFSQEFLSSEQVLDIMGLLYGAMTCLILLLGFELLSRYLAADKQTQTDAAYQVFLVIAVGVIGYGVYMCLAIVNYGFITGISTADGWVALQVTMVLIILVPISLVSEKIVFKKNNSVITTVIGVSIICYATILTIFEFIDPLLYTIILFIPVFIAIAILGVIGLLGFWIIFFVRLRSQKDITRKIVFALIFGMIGLIGAYIEARGRATNSMIYIYGTVVEIITWLIIRHYILSIPSYQAFEWRKALKELQITLLGSGIPIYREFFQSSNSVPKTVIIDEAEQRKLEELNKSKQSAFELFEEGQLGIQMLLTEIMQSQEKINFITINDQFVYFKKGQFLMVVLITDQHLELYVHMLNRLVDDLERANPQLNDFKGDAASLKIREYVSQIFQSPLDSSQTKPTQQTEENSNQ